MIIIYNLALILFLQPQTNKEYITKYYPIAKICEYIYGVPVSIQIAQAIMESGGGRSYIAKNSNNHFGIKYFQKSDLYTEFKDRSGTGWRSYSNSYIGYIDHAIFVNKHYKSVCFKNYTAWSGLKGYGRANYWSEIVNIVENMKLYTLDK